MSDYVPEDLMPEILKWLPVKSLARFRCVRRSWNHLITSASFIADHLACSSMKPRLLVGYRSGRLIEERMGPHYILVDSEMLEVNAKTLLPPFEVLPELWWSHDAVGSVNGVLCLSNRSNPEIVLWNPLIRKYIPLPRLLFKNWGCHGLIGFGVNESEDDFKVIRVSYITVFDESEKGFCMVQVCSARDRIWRALSADILENCRILEDHRLPQCLVNGVVHWIVSVDAAGGSSKNTLLSFDFEGEVLSYLALPENLADADHSNLQVRRFRGMLGVLEYDQTRLGIWAMSEYGDVSSWCFIISVDTLCYHDPYFRREARVLGLTEGGQIIISEGDVYRPYDDDELFLYNPANRTRRQLHLEEKVKEICAPDFVESLIFMDKESGAVSLPAIEFSAVIPGSP